MNQTPQWALERIKKARINNSSELELAWIYHDYIEARKIHEIDGRSAVYGKEPIINKLSEVPIEVLELSNLTHLTLSYNNITELPEWFCQLSNLVFLDLSKNNLSTLPENFSRLTNLKHLILSHNSLRVLSNEFRQLKSLKYLGISNNQLEVLPRAVVELPNLEHIFLHDNPWQNPPLEIVSQGLDAIRGYFRLLDEHGQAQLYEAKLLILGDPGAGKTSLAYKLLDPSGPLPEDDKTTRGIELFNWQFPIHNRMNFRANIWDFGGQDIYHSTHNFFLTRRSMYVLMTDTREQRTDFSDWLQTVELFGQDSPVLIIQNEKHGHKGNLELSREKAHFRNLLGPLNTNLKDNSGLTEIRNAIEKQLRTLPQIGDPLPAAWVDVRKALEDIAEPYISQESYLSICNTKSIGNRSYGLQLSQYLHDLGVILHFQDEPSLAPYVILKPAWLTSAVYCVVDSDTVFNQNGSFSRKQANDFWDDERYLGMHSVLLDLMEKFELIYRIPDSDDYIMPQRLPNKAPNYAWNAENNLHMRYQYDFMPKGLLARLMVNLHSLIMRDAQELVWQRGMILNRDGTNVEIVENLRGDAIEMRANGRNPRNLLEYAGVTLERLHKRYGDKLKYSKMIPCNCLTCQELDTPHFYSHDNLYKRIDNQKFTVECDNPPFYEVDIRDLITDIRQQATELGFIEKKVYHEQEFAPNSVYFSYKWGGQSEETVKQVKSILEARGFHTVLDKEDLKYKGNIREFMRQIGKGSVVIVVISDEYLKSENCMYELIEIASHEKFEDRIIPLVLEDAKIHKPKDRVAYVKYWQEEQKALEARIRELDDLNNVADFVDDYEHYRTIKENLANLARIIGNMNTLSRRIHENRMFEDMINAINNRLSM